MSATMVPHWGKRIPSGVLLIAVAHAACCSDPAKGQNFNDLLVLPPSRTTEALVVDSYLQYDSAPGLAPYEVTPTPRLIEASINTNYLARAAVFGDSTRLASFASGAFLPSAIPVAGQPYFGTGSRANLQGAGSAVRVSAFNPSTSSNQISAYADLVLDNATFSTDAGDGSLGVSVRSIVATIDRFTIGVTESAFADPSAVPETIDFAGPSARVTVYDAGLKGGQGRLSYDFFGQGEGGFRLVGSLEQAIPELAYTTTTESRFSYLPDVVLAPQFVSGECENGKFVERWHVQFASVFRSLAIENPDATEQSEFGWGTSLSGACRFQLKPSLNVLDRAFCSITYGEGVSHYIADLNAAADTGDAAVNSLSELVSLPVLAWYCGYTHNWTDELRSTLTYSRIDLDSVTPRLPAASPYRTSDYLAVNLIRHVTIEKRNAFLGVEYLYGRKMTLDGSSGDAHRLMIAMALSK